MKKAKESIKPSGSIAVFCGLLCWRYAEKSKTQPTEQLYAEKNNAYAEKSKTRAENSNDLGFFTLKKAKRINKAFPVALSYASYRGACWD
ncbi:hypothetical protein [Thalassospira sp. CH_XMU1420-2]|jgi:hypothetical protein|uniref:hypothetical protein n=1 Tax=Thalassospira sp. CH_XMU1420-2 TaxID=3107769 RepID=UPI0030087F3A|tara:strand:+ start:4677 stop:4946 length:270 start_codon:yes stop_codon:yes gene_type:complete